jgi:hypothetical protein
MKSTLINPIDYSKMTEDEFFNFLDSESTRIRKENHIKPILKLDRLSQIKSYKTSKQLKK